MSDRRYAAFTTCPGHLDYFGPAPDSCPAEVLGGDIVEGDDVLVRGWLYDDESRRPPGSAVVLIDARIVATVRLGARRADASRSFGLPDDTLIGIDAVLSGVRVRVGEHDVAIGFRRPDGKLVLVGGRRSVRVVAPPIEEPPSAAEPAGGFFGLEDVGDASRPARGDFDRSVDRRHTVLFRSWALDADYRPWSRAVVRVDGPVRQWFPARRRISTGAARLRTRLADRRGGWQAIVPTRELRPGFYQIDLYVAGPGGPFRRAGGAHFRLADRFTTPIVEGLAHLLTEVRVDVRAFGSEGGRSRAAAGEFPVVERHAPLVVEIDVGRATVLPAEPTIFARIDGEWDAYLARGAGTAFGAVIDVERLDAGRHVAEVFALNAPATGLYRLHTVWFDVEDDHGEPVVVRDDDVLATSGLGSPRNPG